MMFRSFMILSLATAASAGFAEDTCTQADWVPLDNSLSPTTRVRCCATEYGSKGQFGSCDTSSCPNNFNHMKNRNCFNYGAANNNNNKITTKTTETEPTKDPIHVLTLTVTTPFAMFSFTLILTATRTVATMTRTVTVSERSNVTPRVLPFPLPFVASNDTPMDWLTTKILPIRNVTEPQTDSRPEMTASTMAYPRTGRSVDPVRIPLPSSKRPPSLLMVLPCQRRHPNQDRLFQRTMMS